MRCAEPIDLVCTRIAGEESERPRIAVVAHPRPCVVQRRLACELRDAAAGNPEPAIVREAEHLLHDHPPTTLVEYAPTANGSSMASVVAFVRAGRRPARPWNPRALAAVYRALVRTGAPDRRRLPQEAKTRHEARPPRRVCVREGAAARVGHAQRHCESLEAILMTTGVPDELWNAIGTGRLAVVAALRLVHAASSGGAVRDAAFIRAHLP